MRSSAWLMFGVLALQGCMPPAGMGGMAERNRGNLVPVEADQKLRPMHGLRFDLELARRHLDTLVLQGAELCFPATVAQARDRDVRITRELAGGLDFDAANDLIVQRQNLERLQRQLDYARANDSCNRQPGTGDKPLDNLGKRLDDLLNSDDQFLLGSAELDPKYVGRLAEAAALLRENTHYSLRVVGFADPAREKGMSVNLPMERARQISRYLQVMGIAPERIDVDAVNSDNPYFSGSGGGKRLVNRKVGVDLIETGKKPVDPSQFRPVK